MRYSKSHEWVNCDSQQKVATIGVTDFAQKELGEIVYVELPKKGQQVGAGGEAAVLESTKAAADVYSPVSGTIIEVNEQLKDNSGLINSSPEKDGWIFKIALSQPTELEQLYDAQGYKELIKAGI